MPYHISNLDITLGFVKNTLGSIIDFVFMIGPFLIIGSVLYFLYDEIMGIDITKFFHSKTKPSSSKDEYQLKTK